MIPAGYLLKRVVAPPEYLAGAAITDVCSVSHCLNDDVVDVQKVWQHNGFGVANDPATLWSLAPDISPDAGATLFYYEAYEEEIESDGWSFDPQAWRRLSPVSSAGVDTSVTPPPHQYQVTLLGYDVVVFGDFLEHSPLSCNHVAAEVSVNEHCLFDTLEAAKRAIDTGAFGGGCEDGIYRIFSVSIVDTVTGAP
jgi:hypothetical protein